MTTPESLIEYPEKIYAANPRIMQNIHGVENQIGMWLTLEPEGDCATYIRDDLMGAPERKRVCESVGATPAAPANSDTFIDFVDRHISMPAENDYKRLLHDWYSSCKFIKDEAERKVTEREEKSEKEQKQAESFRAGTSEAFEELVCVYEKALADSDKQHKEEIAMLQQREILGNELWECKVANGEITMLYVKALEEIEQLKAATQPVRKSQQEISINVEQLADMIWQKIQPGAAGISRSAIAEQIRESLPMREYEWVSVPDEDVEVAIAEAIAVMEPKTDYCEKGIPVLKALKKYGWRIMQENKS